MVKGKNRDGTALAKWGTSEFVLDIRVGHYQMSRSMGRNGKIGMEHRGLMSPRSVLGHTLHYMYDIDRAS